MSLTTKSSSLQSYNMLIYRIALHPEFFAIQNRQRLTADDYDFEAWIFQGGHAIRFEHGGLCASEVITDAADQLPERGLVTSLPCAGEKDHETNFAERISYLTSVQTEILTDHLFLGTYNELLEHGRESNCLLSTWSDTPSHHNLSMVDTQQYNDEVHVQGYHLRSDCGLVLRTQSIFQFKQPK